MRRSFHGVIFVVVFITIFSSFLSILLPAQTIQELREYAKSGRPSDLSAYGKALLSLPNAKENVEEAIRVLNKACDGDNTAAMLSLAQLYMEGKLVAADHKKAVSYLTRAAELGDAQAFYNLAICHLRGDGVPKNIEQAYSLMKTAAAQGNKSAIQWLEKNPEPTKGPKSEETASEGSNKDSSPGDGPMIPVSKQKQTVELQQTAPTLFNKMITPEALAGDRIGGDILATKALLRILSGPLNEEEEKQLNSRYAAAYSNPSEKVCKHHRKLNKILIDALGERLLMVQSAREYDAAMLEAYVMQLIGGGTAGASDAMNEAVQIAEIQKQMIEASANRLEIIWQEAEKLSKTESKETQEPSVSGDKDYSENMQVLCSSAGRSSEEKTQNLFGTWVLLETKVDSRQARPKYNEKIVLKEIGGSLDYVEWARLVVSGDFWSNEHGRDWALFERFVRFNFQWAMPPKEIPLFQEEMSSIIELKASADLSASDANYINGHEYKNPASDRFSQTISLHQFCYWSDITPELYDKYYSPLGVGEHLTVTYRKGHQLEQYKKNGVDDKNDGCPAKSETTFKLSIGGYSDAYMLPDGRVLRRDYNGNQVPVDESKARMEIVYVTSAGRVRFIYAWKSSSTYKPVLKEQGEIVFSPNLDEEKKLAIAEHLLNIRYAQKAIDGFKEDLRKAQDEATVDRLRFGILHLEQDIHDSKDMIESIKTGKLVHTRGPWEKHAEAVAIQTTRMMYDEIAQTQEIQAAALRIASVIGQYSPEKAREVHNIIIQRICRGALSEGGIARAREALEQIRGTAMAECRQAQTQRYADQEIAQVRQASAEYNLRFVEGVGKYSRDALGYVSMISPVGPSTAILLTYEGLAVSLNTRDPVAGLKQLASDGLNMAAMAGMMKVGSGIFGKFVNPKMPPTPDQFKNIGGYTREVSDAKFFIRKMDEAQRNLASAHARGATAAEIAKLEAALVDSVASINSNYVAKNMLKAEVTLAKQSLNMVEKQIAATSKNKAATEILMKSRAEAMERLANALKSNENYAKTLREKIYSKVDDEMVKKLKDAGYNIDKEWFTEFRNASSRGLNRDRDLGLVPNCEGFLTKNKKKVDLKTFMDDAQKAYDESYRAITKRSPRLADQNITSSVHKEAFPLEFLDSGKVWTAGPNEARKAGQTIFTKVQSALAGSESDVTKTLKAYASLSKDIETKVLPLIASKQPRGTMTAEKLQKAKDYLAQVAGIMSDCSSGQIDPIDATRKMQMLTGGKTVSQVAENVRLVMIQISGLGTAR